MTTCNENGGGGIDISTGGKAREEELEKNCLGKGAGERLALDGLDTKRCGCKGMREGRT